MHDQDEIAGAVRGALADRDDLTAVYLFGSVAEGRAHTPGDVDMAVLFEPQVPEASVFARTLEICAALEAALPVPVDVVTLNRAGPAWCAFATSWCMTAWKLTQALSTTT